MPTEAQEIAYELLRSGTCVLFRIVEEEVLSAPADEAEFGMRVQLKFTGDPQDIQDEDDEENAAESTAEWGALGFLFVLAVLSFADARPRGYSHHEYHKKDELRLADFMQGVRFVRGTLRYEADYVRGRRMKTRITVRSDGTVTLETTGRGKAPLRWLERLQGRNPLQVVGGQESDGAV
jgi:hypothetical protein